MTGAMAKEYEIWLMAPNQDLTSVMLLGLGKFMILSMNCGVGLMPSFVTRNPRKLTSSWAN